MSFFSSFGEAWLFLTSIVMGITMVMGVSAVTSAPSYMTRYYKYILKDDGAVPANQKFWDTVLTFYVVVTMVTQTIFEPMNLTTFCRRFSLNFRLQTACVLMLVELLVLLLIPVSSNVSEKSAMAALMVMAFVGGVGRAFYENTGYALFGTCPPTTISAFVIGAAVSGALTSALQIIIKASMSDDFNSVKKQAYIYFSTAIGIIVVTMIMLWSLSKNSFARERILELRSKRSFFANIYRKHTAEIRSNVVPGDLTDLNEEKEENLGNDCASSGEDPYETGWLLSVRLWPIIKKIYPVQFSCFFTYFMTFLLFPGVLLAVDVNDSWYGTIVVAVFSFGDLFGRLLCLIRRLWLPRRWVVICTFLRLLLVPLMVLCAKGYIRSLAAAHVISTVTGITNGYLATISVSYGPETEGLETDGEKALAGQAIGVCLLFGVSTGSLLQLAIVLAL
ncbi:nucleoside transporter-like, putative [Trypanosoma cruzi marinkellei]|uniref:Nucleoside transporter-like, putative n=1 Tax=Trypanosoma cruzi marinkellei TaxID=85056 RepID=K2NIN9_TRYCR|nr:nucleoside transporter-like, putative [Trypanosoma cruzi marinkellei]